MNSFDLDTINQIILKEYHQLNERIRNKLNKDFEIVWNLNPLNILPTFIHRQTQTFFRYIPGGEFDMGLSQMEEFAAQKICNPIPANLEEMRPVHPVRISPFLLSTYPVLNHLAEQILIFDKQQKESSYMPAFLSREQANYLVAKLGCRLPYEKEWEYACRATTMTLFTFGNDLPEDKELEKWLSWDFANIDKISSNLFGLYGMFTGEWCMDEYRTNYNDDSPIEKGSYVIRGGGAFFWPWQDQEWVWCMSAMRMPSKDTLDGKCGLRLVYDLGV